MPAVLIGDDIRNNIQDLTKDPTVIEMYKDFKKAGFSVKNEYHNSLSFFDVARMVYWNRGGRNSKTIGAVAAAMLELEIQEENI